jgi:hypothetical protein
MTVTANMSFSEGQSFLISTRIGSGCAFLPSKDHARFRTVPRFWDEHFILFELIPIAFGCFNQGMVKLHFLRRLRRPVSQRQLSLPLLLLSPLLLPLLVLLLYLGLLLLLLSLLLLVIRSARHVLSPVRDLSNHFQLASLIQFL